MKKISLTIVMSALMLVSCQDDFLDLDPQDSITEAAYFKTPAHFQAAANDFYNKMISWRPINSSNIFDFMDFGSDLNSLVQPYGRGVITVPNTDVYYTNAYKYIRANNILIAKAGTYSGNPAEISKYVAEAKFFRAWHHFFLLKRYGGVPIVTTVVDFNSPELYAARNSRYQVMVQLLKDLSEAIPDLPVEQSIGSSDKGHISRWAAEAFKARVLLYEATWERYVGNSTDGDGAGVGAGSAGAGSNVETYLQEAITLARDVMDNGGYELWNYNSTLNNKSMFYLFNLEDSNSNPAGLDKTSNKEFILASKYDYNLYQGGTNLSHTVSTRMAPSRKFMDMFLATDGLPISQSALFQGYANTPDEYQNRDYRLLSYFANPATDQAYINGAVKLLGAGADSGSGYANRKFRSYNYGTYRAANTESADYPQIRLAEVYLMYAEALYELNGSITDAQLAESINKTRARGGLPALTNTFVTANGMNMLNEIRRERAIELFGENSRFDDLKRWGIAETELNQDVFGSVIQGSVYDNNATLYTPANYPYGEAVTQTGRGQLETLLLDPASNRNFARQHYLFPIPMSQLQLNTNLKQNPGY
nr:RagB/SusD family nutrient uptake outer membrane protein [uncultured Flavobacterium sp.]